MLLQLDDKTHLEKQFGARFAFRENPRLRIACADLLEPEGLSGVIHLLTKVYQSPNRVISASQFTKYYARMLCTVLYYMSCLNRRMDSSPEHLYLEFDQAYEPAIKFPETGEASPSHEERARWREGIVRSLFAGHLHVLFEAIQRLTGLSKRVMWENTVIYIHYYYPTWAKEHSSPSIVNRVKEDYDYIIHQASGELFGVCETNPLQIKGRYISHSADSPEPIRIRKSCCLRYHLSCGAKCTTCPIKSS